MFNKKVIDEIFNNHSKPLEGSVHKEYNIDKDVLIYVHQDGSRIVMSAINDKTERQLNLGAAKYKEVIKIFKSIMVFKISEMLLERGISINPTTIMRWVH